MFLNDNERDNNICDLCISLRLLVIGLLQVSVGSLLTRDKLAFKQHPCCISISGEIKLVTVGYILIFYLHIHFFLNIHRLAK